MRSRGSDALEIGLSPKIGSNCVARDKGDTNKGDTNKGDTQKERHCKND
jgi:hypothetical protein